MTEKNVVSIVPQLLCGKLAKMLGQYLDNFPDATPERMLEVCEEIMHEIGAVKVDGAWTMPEDAT